MDNWNRRDFIKAPFLGAAALPLVRAQSAAEAPESIDGAVDVNVMLFQWPFRRMDWDQSGVLAEGLHHFGVNQAWTGSFEALLHRDMGGVNTRLAKECRQHGDGLFIPFGTVNPVLPDWEEDLRRCDEEHGMPGIRLYPGYHGYQLSDDSAAGLFAAAAERNLLIQIAVLMEDPRTGHPLLNVSAVDVEPLGRILAANPNLKVMLLNAPRNVLAEHIENFNSQSNLYSDISWLEGLRGVERLVSEIPPQQVCFGSYSPIFYFEASWLKMKESILEKEVMEAIVKENAKRII